MTSQKWQRVTDLFEAALARDSEERAAFLAQTDDRDEEVRREVESLLEAHERDAGFMNTPAGNLLLDVKPVLTAGQRFGHYEKISPLGEGGMGQVYLAVDTRLGRRVALKLLPASYTGDADRVRRFTQEARTASALNHPNIVTIHEIGEADALPYIATEFIEGETLRERLIKTRMTFGEALDVAAQVASALEAAHEAGIVHRDVKPENIMLRRDGFVKVLDFGLAKLTGLENEETENLTQSAQPNPRAADPIPHLTNPRVVMGTAGYMSPEQARGEEVDARTDIWSLGVVLYEMVTGRVPFRGETPSHTVVSIIEHDPAPLADYSEVPAELERIISKALRKERKERYQSAGEVALDLKSLKEELNVEVRLRQFQQAEAGEEIATKHADSRTINIAQAPVTSTAVIARGRFTAGAQDLGKGIKRHRGRAVFASVTGLLLVASLFYFLKPTTGGGEPIDSVAVLPFINEGSDPNVEYLSDGISDSTISSLANLPNLRVTSLNSVLRYKGKQTDAQTIGRELNVRAVLIGRLRQRGEDLTISVELVDVRDNRRLWGGQYSRKPSELLTVQAEIAQQISSGLRLRLSGPEKKLLAKQYTDNTEAYQLYILGRHYHRKHTKEDYEKSIEYFEQAVKVDSAYALAYIGLARAYHWMGTRGFWPTKESEQKSEWALLKALELDDKLADAHARLGGLKFSNFDWAGAEKYLKRALELDPNSLDANSAYFQYLAAIGRPDEALPYALRAYEIDPTADPGGLGFSYFMARKYDKAIESYQEWLQKNPENAHAHILLGEAYVAKGMAEEGVTEIQKGVALDPSLGKTPERWDRYPMLAYAFAAAGRRAEALKILVEQKRLATQRNVSPYNFAIIYTGLGDKDQAFAWLEKCIEQRTRLVYRLKSRPMFDSLRSDARYPVLLRRMNLEP